MLKEGFNKTIQFLPEKYFVANSIDFYLSSCLRSVYFSKSKFEFKNLNFFEFKFDKNINGSTL